MLTVTRGRLFASPGTLPANAPTGFRSGSGLDNPLVLVLFSFINATRCLLGVYIHRYILFKHSSLVIYTLGRGDPFCSFLPAQIRISIVYLLDTSSTISLIPC